MENYPYPNSYPDSGHSSPRSREIDCENASWDDQPLSSGYKVKLMCSYGGKIHPRPHDNQLTYVGGDTKILAVDRNIRFSSFISKLSNLCDSDMCFRLVHGRLIGRKEVWFWKSPNYQKIHIVASGFLSQFVTWNAIIVTLEQLLWSLLESRLTLCSLMWIYMN